MTEIRLQIDELVLHGFDPRQRHALADAVQAELTRLLAASPIEPPVATASHRRLDAGTFDLAQGSRPATTGAALAAAVHAAIQPLIAASPPTEPRDG